MAIAFNAIIQLKIVEYLDSIIFTFNTLPGFTVLYGFISFEKKILNHLLYYSFYLFYSFYSFY